MSATAKSSLASCSVLKATMSHECDGEKLFSVMLCIKNHEVS
ncbi:MAG: hypothetical protein ACOYIT_06120 [Christensenellales bacterium]